MKVNVHSQKGNKLTATVDLDDAVFAVEPNQDLLAQYVYIYNSNQRASIAHTKDRGDVSGGGAKPWRQKGTGKARVGSNRSPIWTGGGVTFGPTNRRNWKKNINKKMKRGALRSALSQLVAAEALTIVDKFDFEPQRITKQAADFAAAFNSPRKFTIVVPANSKEVQAAFNNIPNANVVSVEELNAYTVLNAGHLFIEKAALEYMQVWA